MANRIFELSNGQENELLKVINSISFDYTFLVDIRTGSAKLTKYVDGVAVADGVREDLITSLVERAHPDDRLLLEKEIQHAQKSDENIRFEMRLKESGGRRYRWLSIRVHRTEMNGQCLYAGSANYIDSRKNREIALTTKARQDSLTGLLNKAATRESVEDYIKAYSERPGAMIVLDIDNFKNYNDRYGHLFGDEVIRNTGIILRRVFGQDAIVGRIGGDEFLIYVKLFREFSDIVSKMGKLRDMLTNVMMTQNGRISVTCSIGISLYPDTGSDYDTLFKTADIALYHIKRTTKDNFAIYTDDLNETATPDTTAKEPDESETFEDRRRYLEYVKDFDKAMADGEFYVVLQPKVSGSEKKLKGAEALVRWRKPDGTEILPGEFIPALEKGGCIEKLDFFVYEKVLSYIHERLAKGRRVIPVSLNASAAHLKTADFAERFTELLKKYEVAAKYTELEFSEKAYIDDPQRFNRTAVKLRNGGIKVSVDGFQNASTEMNAIDGLKADILKIDRAFMKNSMLGSSDRAVLRSIMEMAEKLRMQVACEGVENEAQREFLNEAGLSLQQGYLYSKPVEIKTFDSYLDDENLLFAKAG